MKGKVFSDSSNIYEDQARVLFDYFKGVAQNIVTQEIEFEKKIENTLADKTASQQRQSDAFRKNLIGLVISVVVGLALVVFGHAFLGLAGLIGLAVFGMLMFLGKKKESKFQEECDKKIATFSEQKTAIRRDYKVHKIGTAYVPVATQIPFQGQSFFMDNTGTQAKQKFTLYDIKDKEGLNSAAAGIEETLTKIPVVDSTEDCESLDTSSLSPSIPRISLGDWSSHLDRNVRRLNYIFSDLDETSVSIPVIDPHSPLSEFLKEQGNDEAPEELKIRLYDTSGLQEALASFESLAEMSKSRTSGGEKGIEDFCRSLMEKAAVTLQFVSEGRTRSLEKVNQYGLTYFGTFLKGSFNYYSPELEAENIRRIKEEKFNFTDSVESYEPLILNKSSRVHYDLISDNWVAEDGSRTSNPYGVHQIFEEIFMPMVSNLMKENRLERLKVYNDIKNQKIDYLNQWHRDTDDFYGRNRAEINEISNRIRSITAEYLSDLNTFKALSDTISSMEGGADPTRIKEINQEATNIGIMMAQAQDYRNFIEQFNSRFDNFRVQITELAQSFEHIEFFEASLRDAEARDAAQALSTENWDSRRKVLIRLGHQIAKNSTLLPEPKLEDLAERDSLINLIAMYENLKSELEQEERAAMEAEAQAKSSPAQSPEMENSSETQVEEENNEDSDSLANGEDEDEVDEEDEEDEEDQNSWLPTNSTLMSIPRPWDGHFLVFLRM